MQTDQVEVPFHVVNNSILILAEVLAASGIYQPVGFILDTGDAVGPVFNGAAAVFLGLSKGATLDITGAGGATTNFATVATVKLGPLVFRNELGAIDQNLQGPPLMGLPFFLTKTRTMKFDFVKNTLYLEPR